MKKVVGRRRALGLSAGRVAALLLGLCAPVAIWSLSSKLSGASHASAVASFASGETASEKGQASSRRAVSWDQLPAPADQRSAEGRLLEIYRLIGQGEHTQAMAKAKSLTDDIPTFQLAQLVYGDLLLAQTAPIHQLGAVPVDLAGKAGTRLAQLRQEADRRLAALQERPPNNAVPSQFIALPDTTQHAIAVDASRSRLYLFENGPQGVHLVGDYYASIGKLGPDKNSQGDQRTPIGVYYITSRLDAEQLTDFYGVGALPLNYPNEYDRKLGRTGSGIWLHGVPKDSYARSPMSTDGCVALANPELQRIMAQVQPRTTPVVIARELSWKNRDEMRQAREPFDRMLAQWRQARSGRDVRQLMRYYASDFMAGKKDRAQWQKSLETELVNQSKAGIEMKDVAILGWQDRTDILVVTFGEIEVGQRTGVIKRQYWAKENGQWKIFFEGVIG